jgi:hypothetical protein
MSESPYERLEPLKHSTDAGASAAGPRALPADEGQASPNELVVATA